MTASSGRSFSMARPGARCPPTEAVAGTGVEPDDGEDAVLGDEVLVDIAAEATAAGTQDVLDRLDRELVGLAPVKRRIDEIASLLLVDRLRRRFGLESTKPSLHMCFTGGPGTGKTTVATRMAELLHRLGYIRSPHLVTVTRDDVVGQYVGHTAPKTKEVLKRAMGGVLFIDEAYYLYRVDNERDYGQETIEILLQVMENQRDDIVVILAGYRDRMDVFFQANPGMASRIAHHIDFPDYRLDELVAIAELMLREQQYELSEEARAVLREYLTRRMNRPQFANARSVRNAIERARLRQAKRLVSTTSRRIGKADLIRIEADDLLASRILDDGSSGGLPASGAEAS